MTAEAPHRFRDTRYDRQEAVPRLSAEGQSKLGRSRVAVVGAGGVKSPLLLYLAAAGVGLVRIIDFDLVELSNLNRQILYTCHDVGRPKALAAAERLRSLNPDIRIEAVVDRLQEDNFAQLLGDSDLVLEGGDSVASRRTFNRLAIEKGAMYVHASAQYNYAYVFTVIPRKSACFECLYSELPPTDGGPVPVLGPAAGVAGSVAACECINILSGTGPTLADRIWLHDGWANRTLSIPVRRRVSCAVCG